MANETVAVPVALMEQIFSDLNNADGYTSLWYSRHRRDLPRELEADLRNFTSQVRRTISDVQEFI